MSYYEKYTKLNKKQPCRTCMDFDQWTKEYSKKKNNSNLSRKNCPLDSIKLGRKTWAFLHTMAAYYPDNPSIQDQNDMKKFIFLLSKFYPCQPCAEHLQQSLKLPELNPDTSSKHALSQYFCKLHNHINKYLGKPEFDCSNVMQRWYYGWNDGSCD